MTSIRRLYYPLCRSRLGHRVARMAIRALRAIGWHRDFFLPLDALTLDHRAVNGLARLWSRIHWSAGDGMMPAEQLLAVYRLAVDWPVEGDTVELGAWTGLTTCYLATACRVRRAGHVYAVDTFAGTKEGGETYASANRYGGSTWRAFESRIKQAGVVDLVTPLVELTTEMASRYTGNAIRLLLIDADHSFEGVRQDFDHWLPHMAPGGLIVFHDYLMADVARFVDEHVRRDSRVDVNPGHVVTNVFATTYRGRFDRKNSIHRATPAKDLRPMEVGA